MVHFDTRDIQATVQAIKDGGGTIRMEPTDVMGQGWLAQATDPQGAEFALWQSGRTAGFELGSAPTASSGWNSTCRTRPGTSPSTTACSAGGTRR